MIHQFEEYGLDLKGRHFYFHQIICGKLGYSSTADCTIQAWHLTFINLVLMTWAALRARSAPAGPGANFFGLAAFNALVHIVPGAIDAAHGGDLYNPGQLSALVILIPGAVGALRALYRQRVITGAGIARALAVGMLAHVIHFFGHYLRSREIINDVIWIPYLIATFIGFMSLAFP
ncbi:HXXEE domain-containing protein [Teratosphaeria destructans]|uniref:HXXEE domain-containing protein n=1 Tax=Teratosphaeria destructans TaxID=418781 RepID=A0A9W7W189_9PEZI|nr:HXXEE domain-containing protein [Teratosphaeria destructans]